MTDEKSGNSIPDAKLAEQIEEQLANEVANLRDLAVKSCDPLVVAKAVAASDLGVQQMIRDKLTTGERLIEVFVLQSAAQSELQVFFRFVQAKEIAPFVDKGILVFVDSLRGEVTGTVDPFILQPERRVGRPFVAIAALKTSSLAASNHAMEQDVDRERAFFKSLGLWRWGLGVSSDTVCNTDLLSVTYKPTGPGGRYIGEDTGKETTGDYCDSAGPILA